MRDRRNVAAAAHAGHVQRFIPPRRAERPKPPQRSSPSRRPAIPRIRSAVPGSGGTASLPRGASHRCSSISLRIQWAENRARSRKRVRHEYRGGAALKQRGYAESDEECARVRRDCARVSGAALSPSRAALCGGLCACPTRGAPHSRPTPRGWNCPTRPLPTLRNRLCREGRPRSASPLGHAHDPVCAEFARTRDRPGRAAAVAEVRAAARRARIPRSRPISAAATARTAVSLV